MAGGGQVQPVTVSAEPAEPSQPALAAAAADDGTKAVSKEAAIKKYNLPSSLLAS